MIKKKEHSSNLKSKYKIHVFALLSKSYVLISIHVKCTEPRDTRFLDMDFLLIDAEKEENRKRCYYGVIN